MHVYIYIYIYIYIRMYMCMDYIHVHINTFEPHKINNHILVCVCVFIYIPYTYINTHTLSYMYIWYTAVKEGHVRLVNLLGDEGADKALYLSPCKPKIVYIYIYNVFIHVYVSHVHLCNTGPYRRVTSRFWTCCLTRAQIRPYVRPFKTKLVYVYI